MFMLMFRPSSLAHKRLYASYAYAYACVTSGDQGYAYAYACVASEDRAN